MTCLTLLVCLKSRQLFSVDFGWDFVCFYFHIRRGRGYSLLPDSKQLKVKPRDLGLYWFEVYLGFHMFLFQWAVFSCYSSFPVLIASEGPYQLGGRHKAACCGTVDDRGWDSLEVWWGGIAPNAALNWDGETMVQIEPEILRVAS